MTSSSSSEEGDSPRTASVNGEGSNDSQCASNGVMVREDGEEMVFSGGAWREVILKDLEDGVSAQN